MRGSVAVCVLVGLLLCLAAPATAQCPLRFDAIHSYPDVAASGACKGDFDGDGRADIARVVAGAGPHIELWHAAGEGWFDRVTSDLLQSFGRPTAGDFNGDGDLDVVVQSTWPSPALEVLLGRGNGKFVHLPPLTVTGSWNLTAGDVDGDGYDDLVGAADGIEVRISNGDGTFQAPVGYANGWSFEYPVLALVDGGASLDIVASLPSALGVLLNNGDGTYQPLVMYGSTGMWGRPAVADVDEDGNPDVVASGPVVHLGNGDGTLQPPFSLPPVGGVVGVGDIDGDGHADILEISSQMDKHLCARRGHGDGTFDSPECERVGGNSGSSAWWIDAADIDGDGVEDVVADVGEAFLAVLGRPSGPFPVASHLGGLPWSFLPGTIDAGDWNGDGILDLMTTAYPSPGGLHLAVGTATGFAPFAVVQIADGVSPAVADFDRDGRLDIAADSTVGAGMTIFLGDGTGEFRLASAAGSAGWSLSTAVGDVNRDGFPDIFRGYDLYLVGPGGTLQPPIRLPLSAASVGNVLADMNGDGLLDAAAVDHGSNIAQVLLGNGNGTFSGVATYPAGSEPHDLISVDLDEDGKVDLVTANFLDRTVSVLIGNGDGTFQSARTFAAGLAPDALGSADLDGDGHTDLIVTDNWGAQSLRLRILAGGTTAVHIFRGDGTGNLGYAGSIQTWEPMDAALADFDRDGAPDLVAVTTNDQRDPDAVLAYNASLGTVPADLPAASLGIPYAQTLAGSGGTPPYAFSLAGGSLPPGLGLSPVGTISGTPVIAGRFRFTVRIADASGCNRTAPREVIVLGCPIVSVTPLSLPGGFAGVPYTATVTASGGTPPYSYALTAGFLPAGLFLDRAQGVISGTPSAAVVEAFTITVTDVNGCSGSAAFTVAIDTCDPIVVSPAILPAAQVGVSYAQTLTASGGAAPYGWAVTSGALPAGLALDGATGVLSGTPTQVGAPSFTVTATDSRGCTGSRPYTLTVDCSAITIQPASLPDGAEGIAYAQTLTAAGGTAPYTFAVTAGALPAGLALDGSTGAVTGTPSLADSETFTVTATDASALPCTGSRAYTIDVAAAVDHVAGEGLGRTNGNGVRVHRRDGLAAGTFFYAYGAGQWGTNVGTGNVDGGSYAEVLTGPGPGDVYGPHVRAWRRDGTPIAKVGFFAYGTLKYGVNVAAGRLDGDSFDEIQTGPGPGEVFGPHVRAFNFDNATLAAIAKVSFFAFGTLKYGVNVEEGPVDADAYAEILVGAGPGAAFGATIRGFNYDAVMLAAIAKINFNAFATTHGVIVAGGDVDGDGFAEIAAAHGPAPANANTFAGFDYDEAMVVPAPGFIVNPTPASLYGGRLGTGDVTGDGRAELECGAGRDPAAGSTINVYRYTGSALVVVPPSFTPFTAAGYGYGVNVAGGGLGYF